MKSCELEYSCGLESNARHLRAALALALIALAACLFTGALSALPSAAPSVAYADTTSTALVDEASGLKYDYGATGGNVRILGPNKIIIWLEIPDKINGKPVVEIADEAFKGDTAVRDIAFKEGSQVTTIGDSAFNGCTSLAQCSLPASVTTIGESAFEGCTLLSAATFSTNAKATTIGERAFFDCSSLQNIDIPKSVSSIGVDAFRNVNCVSFPDGSTIEEIKANVLGGVKSANLGEGTKVISANAFASKTGSLRNLESVTLPSTLTTIGEKAFQSCAKLGAIAVPDAVTSIGASAFHGCSKLASASFTVNSKLTTISESAFVNCKALEAFDIPKGVTDIGAKAFSGCSKLAGTTIPAKVSVLDTEVFKNCTSLKAAAFAADAALSTIGVSAFEGCSALESISIPDKVTTIENKAFRNCSALQSLTFSEKSTLATINGNYAKKEGAFQNCASLVTVSIPESVTYIGPFAFNGCTLLGSDSENEQVIELLCPNARFGESCLIGIANGSNIVVPNETMYSQLVENGNFVDVEQTAVHVKNSSLKFLPQGGEIGDVSYDKEKNQLTAEVTFNDGEQIRTLTQGTDFTVSDETSAVDGVSRVLVRGKGAYVGFIRKNFRAVQVELPKAPSNLVYDSTKQEGIAATASYTVKNGTGTNAGEYEATLSLVDKANSEWVLADGATSTVDQTVTWTIAPAPVIVKPVDKSKIFGASDPTLKAEVTGLVGKDKASKIKYTLSRAAGENAGDYVISSSGDELQGNYKVQFATGTFTIQRKDLSKAAITLSSTRLDYTGKQVCPDVTVKLAGKTLTKNTDYTLSYANNVDAGTAIASISGIGNYEGLASRNFTIVGSNGSTTTSSSTTGAGAKTGATAMISGTTYRVKSASTVVYQKAPKSKAKVTIPAKVTIGGKSYKVAGIAASAFAGAKAKTVIVKTKSLKKAAVKNCFKGSKVKTVKVPKAKKKAYKKIFTKKNVGKKVKLKAA